MVESAPSYITPRVVDLLSVALSHSIRLGDANQLYNRPDLYRFEVLDGPSTAPSRVVVKVVSAWNSDSTPLSERERLRRLFSNEWTGLTFLQQRNNDPPLTPHLFGGDRETGILVMEDLGMRPALWELLEGNDDQLATTQLVALATALGRMHAQTIGQQTHFEQLCETLASGLPPADNSHSDWITPTLTTSATALDIPLLPTAMDDVAALRQALSESSPFWAYTQGDPSPGNCLFVAPRMRLLDFGVGAYRHAFVDFPPPWCWQKIPPSVMRQMTNAYQRAFATGCPSAADPISFARGLVEGCAYWSVTLLKDWPLAEVAVNEEMRQSLLQVLRSCSELTQKTSYLQSFGAMIAAIVEAIEKRWPVTTRQPAYYPAFQERS